MAYSSLYDERPDVAARPFHPLRAFAGWIAGVRARRARRAALSNLLEMDGAMLRDVGIERIDVIEALRDPRADTGRLLARRRAESARNWRARP